MRSLHRALGIVANVPDAKETCPFVREQRLWSRYWRQFSSGKRYSLRRCLVSTYGMRQQRLRLILGQSVVFESQPVFDEKGASHDVAATEYLICRVIQHTSI